MYSIELVKVFGQVEYHHSYDGIPIKYRFDGKLFNVSQNQGATRNDDWASVYADDIEKLCLNREENARRYGPSFTRLWQLRSHNQHQEDLDWTPTCTWKVVQWTRHLRESTKTTSCWHIHIFCKHSVKRNAEASAAFGRLRGNVRDRSGTRLNTSYKVDNL